MKFKLKRQIAFVLFSFSLFTIPGFAANNPPPPSSSADVIEKKVREEAQQDLLKTKPPQKVTVEQKEPSAEQKQVSFFVRKIRIKGTKDVPSKELRTLVDYDELRPIIKRYLKATHTYAEIQVLAQQLEQIYQKHGYFAIVRIPPQKITKGEVVLQVVISRLGEVQIEGNRFFRKKKTLSYWKVPKGKIMRYDDVQKSVQAMNENPDRQVKLGLAAGKEPGTTNVVLKEQDHFPVHPGFSYDNQAAKLTGRSRFGFTLRDNNLLSLDDVFVTGTVFGDDFGAYYLQHVIPVTDFGTRFLYGFTHSQSLPKKEFKDLGINSISQTYSTMLRQKVLRTDRFAAEAFLGFDFKEKWTHTQSVVTSWDRLRVLSAGTDFQAVDANGFWMLTPTVYTGFSPHGNGYALTSRQAHSHFYRGVLSLERQQKLPWDTKGKLHFEAQMSPYRLPTSEQMFLGGARSVRGYPESDYGADRGIQTNFEYSTPFFLVPADWKLPRMEMTLRKQIQLLAFVDHGYGQVHQPSSTESRARHMLGTGAGFSVQLSKYVSARVEWAAALGQHAMTEGGRSQFYFRLQTEV